MADFARKTGKIPAENRPSKFLKKPIAQAVAFAYILRSVSPEQGSGQHNLRNR